MFSYFSYSGIGRRGYIIDTRSQNIAKLAQAKGGGVEPEMHYPQWRRIHQPIDRHTTLHESLVKLIEGNIWHESFNRKTPFFLF